MQFLYPGFLWGLLALAIPVIIHLFYFRRFKRIYFTNVKFLKEIKEETSSRNKLKNLLILAMRLAAVACLVFAFAQPFIPTGENIKTGDKAVSIYIDNSFSMAAEKENIPLLDLAKERALKIVNAYGEDSRFQILTADFEGRHQRLVSKDEALALIDEIQITPSVQKLSKVINRQKQVLKGDHHISFIISDFQKSTTDIGSWKDSLTELNLLPIQHSIAKNVSIDSAWFSAPVPIIGEANRLVVKYTNHADEAVEDMNATIFKDGQEKPTGLLSIPPRSSIVDTIPLNILKTGIHEAILRIKDFPVQFDDSLYLSFLVKEKVKVLAINESTPDRYLQALFGGIQYFQFDNQEVARTQYQGFKDYDLILLNGVRSLSSGLIDELYKFMETGGKVTVLPGKEADLTSYNALLSRSGSRTLQSWTTQEKKVSTLNTRDFVFSDVFSAVESNLHLPTTKGAYNFGQTASAGSLAILSYRDGSPYLYRSPVGEGQLYVCASNLNTEYNDLASLAEIFVPLLYRMALVKSEGTRLDYFIGKDNLIEIENQKTNGEAVYRLKGASEFIPSQQGFGRKLVLDVKHQVMRAGFYDVVLGERVQEKLAFNYDRQESDLSLYTEAALRDQVKNDAVNILNFEGQEGIQDFVGEKDKGIVLWRWFLLAALLFLLAEVLIIRWVKNG
jgi:hypothetical protein